MDRNGLSSTLTSEVATTEPAANLMNTSAQVDADSVTPAVNQSVAGASTISSGTWHALGGLGVAAAGAGGGVVTVNAPNGSSVTVTFTNGANTVSKTITGTGAAQAVTLTSGDLTTLGDGTITVSAAGSSSFTLDTVVPVAPTLALATDSGTSSSDRVTNVSTVNVSGLEVGATWHYRVDGGSWLTGSGTSFSATDGAHTYAVHQTDVAGNLSSASTALTYNYDHAAPLFSSATTASVTDPGTGIDATTTLYTAAASDAGGGGIQYALSGGADANLFNINSSTGVVTFKTTETYAATQDAGANHVYDFTVSATDAAGNASTNTVALTMGNGPLSILAVYYDAAHTQSAGNLIAPVTVDGGKVFYAWDVTGEGTQGEAGDYVDHNFLDAIFNKDINGTTNPAGPTADTTDIYRYGTLYTSTGSAVQVALPTKGDGGTNTSYLADSTSIGNSTLQLGSNAVNSSYDDLLAIWDAYNGANSHSPGWGDAAVPLNWYGTAIWSATLTSPGNHAYVDFDIGGVETADNSVTLLVAVQVL